MRIQGMLLFLVSTMFINYLAYSQEKYYWSDNRKIKLKEDKSSVIILKRQGSLEKDFAKFMRRDVADIETSVGIKRIIAHFKSAQTKSLKETLKDLNIDSTDIEWSSFVFEYENGTTLKPTNGITLMFKPGYDIASISGLIKDDAVFIRKDFGVIHLRATRYDIDVLSLANRIYESGMVEFCHPDFYANIALYSDPLYGEQYFLNNTGQFGARVNFDLSAPAAWSISTGSSSIKVAVIDDGVEYHEDLLDQNGANRVLPGYTPKPTYNDPQYGEPGYLDRHGQSCAGIIAASHNEIGVRGIAPQIKILPINIQTDETLNSDVAAGINWAWQNGADVLSNSWGYCGAQMCIMMKSKLQ